MHCQEHGTGMTNIECRALVVAGAEGATAPVNFEQRVHAPVNFQPFQFEYALFLIFFLTLSSFSKIYCENVTFRTKMSLSSVHHLLAISFLHPSIETHYEGPDYDAIF